MGFFERTIKNSLSRGLSNAVGNAIEQKVTEAVTPKINQAVNKTADTISQSFGGNKTETYPEPTYSTQTNTNNIAYASQPNVNTEALNQAATNWGSMLVTLSNAANGLANEAAKNMKSCLSCGEVAPANTKFCPSCGTKMPETTILQNFFCPNCGTQNNASTKFCTSCGTKLLNSAVHE